MTTRKNKKWSRMEDMIILSNMDMKPTLLADRIDRTTAAIYNRRLTLTNPKWAPVGKPTYPEDLKKELEKGQLSFDFSAPPAPVVPTRVIPIKTNRPAVKPIALIADRREYEESLTREFNAIRKTPTVNPISLGGMERPAWAPAPKPRPTLRARFLAWLQRG